MAHMGMSESPPVSGALQNRSQYNPKDLGIMVEGLGFRV